MDQDSGHLADFLRVHMSNSSDATFGVPNIPMALNSHKIYNQSTHDGFGLEFMTGNSAIFVLWMVRTRDASICVNQRGCIAFRSSNENF